MPQGVNRDQHLCLASVLSVFFFYCLVLLFHVFKKMLSHIYYAWIYFFFGLWKQELFSSNTPYSGST